MWSRSNQVRAHKLSINSTIHDVINYVFIIILKFLTKTLTWLSFCVSFASTLPIDLGQVWDLETSLVGIWGVKSRLRELFKESLQSI